METQNGEWYLKGCAHNDPARIKSAEEAAAWIQRIGFLPLFSNEVPGFSLEEHTCAADWWTGSPLLDPWEWRGILAGRRDIVYGKFYHRRAGFISAEWFPVFANYRRNGYDFDTLIDEGRAPRRAQKLMAPFLSDGIPNSTSLYSFQLKERAGFGKGGEKNFEGILTELEMHSYLCIADFRQRLNKNGAPYGWHIAIVETPENKLGYEWVTSAYRETPEESQAKLIQRIRSFFPDVAKEQIDSCFGK
ncbi:MAG: hypothetical protein IKQ54_09455 [Oscillospiraceae bacterium]|nr:hypothetical protein [Oscillospiraceae bacterium]